MAASYLIARHCDYDPTPIYTAAARFRECCLLSDGSLFFPDDKLWSASNLQALERVFVDVKDKSNRSFEEKFRDQVQPAGIDVMRLAAEIIAVHFLFPLNVSGWRKRDLVNQVLGWNGDKLAADNPVSIAFERGIGSGGLGYNTRRRFELYFLIYFAKAWKSLSLDEMQNYAADPWRFMDFIDTVEGAESSQLRHMLLHLLFPDHFERIASGDHKRRISSVFGGLLDEKARQLPLDRRLYEIRQELEKLLPKVDLDFYWDPLTKAWYDTAGDSVGMIALDAVQHKKQIVLYGPPGTGKTHQAKVLAAQLIRTEALQRWGAARFFRETEKLEQIIAQRIRRLQLHPAYSYEDFIRGLHLLDGGRTEYRPGYLLELIREIDMEDRNTRLPTVLILDEMNRTDLSRLLGECFSLLENRGETIDLPGRSSDTSKMTMTIPKDLYVIGTMNLIDQSIEQVDFALRRRFLWEECRFDVLKLLTVTERLWNEEAPGYYPWDTVSEEFRRLASAASKLNQAISDSPLLGAQFEIGHTYFFDAVHFLRTDLRDAGWNRKQMLWKKDAPAGPLEDLWNLSLKPLLREYLSGLDARTRHNELSKLEKTFFTKPDPLEIDA